MKSLITAAAMLLMTTVAQAAPIHFQFNAGLVFTDISGTLPTDVVTIDVVMDNGGTSTASQTWNAAAGHFVSGVLSIGSYSMDVGSNVSRAIFITDSSGALLSTAFEDFLFADRADNVDNFGTGGTLINLTHFFVVDFTGDFAQFGGTTEAVGDWLIVSTNQTPIPAPGSLALLGLGMIFLSRARRR